MLMAGVTVGADLGVERGGGVGDGGAQMVGQEMLEHVVGADAQGVRQDLGRGVAIAEVPGDAGQGQRRRRP